MMACVVEPGERAGSTREGFTSSEAVLLDFEFDGRVLMGDADLTRARRLIEAQLMYAVGHLNADRSVGRYERLVISAVEVHSGPSGLEATYHARLPVAWAGSRSPTAYPLVLPARVAEADQVAFATAYAATCTDPSGGAVDAGRMFLFYRPHQNGCQLRDEDVVRTTAQVSRSHDNTVGKYPEYHLIWEDGALDVVAMFSRAQPEPVAGDEGVSAFDEFVVRVSSYLRSLQPDPSRRSANTAMTPPSGAAAPQVKLGAILPDGRAVNVDVVLVSDVLQKDASTFDPWFDALTPKADLIVYSGHAGLGANVRELMTKGSFSPGKYVVWWLNGCDTFAYVDSTLAARRALLNPDDPAGTKYMDTVSNVLGGYFNRTAEGSMTLVEAAIEARALRGTTKTYQQIFEGIDPAQVVVVTGEEDNVFALEPATAREEAAAIATGNAPPEAAPAAAPSPRRARYDGGGCDAAGAHSRRRGGLEDALALALFGAGGALAARRRTRRSDPLALDSIANELR